MPGVVSADGAGAYSRFAVSTKLSYVDLVASCGTNTIVLTNGNPAYVDGYIVGGIVVALTGANKNKVWEVSSYVASTKTITVTSGNCSGFVSTDLVALIPKPDVYVCLTDNTLGEGKTWDEEICYGDMEVKSRDSLTYTFGGDFSGILNEQCKVPSIIFKSLFGRVVHSAGANGNSLHTYSIPTETQTADNAITCFVQEGKGLIRKAYIGGTVTKITIDQAENGNLKYTASLKFSRVVREEGSTGKNWSSNFWNPTISTQTRYNFKKAQVKLNAVAKTYAHKASLTLERTANDDPYLFVNGGFPTTPNLGVLKVSGSWSQLFQTDTEFEQFYGVDSDMSDPPRLPLVLLWTGTSLAGVKLQITIPKCNIDNRKSNPATENTIEEEFEFTGVYDTTYSVQVIYDNGQAI